MPLHLPSAWTHYLDYVASFGVAISQKPRWTQVIQRSFAQIPFSNGLVYSNPQRMLVEFGFHDSIRITGMELMTSLITFRGLQRAARLSKEEIDGSTRQEWLHKAILSGLICTGFLMERWRLCRRLRIGATIQRLGKCPCLRDRG